MSVLEHIWVKISIIQAKCYKLYIFNSVFNKNLHFK